MSSAIIFVTNKKSEATRLLPIVARGNGGVKNFVVETLPSAKPAYAITYKPTFGMNVTENRRVVMMTGFLQGFIGAEKASQQSIARERRLREQHRLGRR